jgi:hypothetical protein
LRLQRIQTKLHKHFEDQDVAKSKPTTPTRPENKSILNPLLEGDGANNSPLAFEAEAMNKNRPELRPITERSTDRALAGHSDSLIDEMAEPVCVEVEEVELSYEQQLLPIAQNEAILDTRRFDP